MRFKNHDGTYTELKAYDYKQKHDYSFYLTEMSDGSFIPTHREYALFTTTLLVKGHRSTIDNILIQLNTLRANNDEVVLDQFEERVFGDNINHGVEIKCIIGNIDEKGSNFLNRYELEITLYPTDVFPIGQTGIPNGLKCLRHTWTGRTEWDFTTHRTYSGNNFFTNNGGDIRSFKGEYMLTMDDNAMLLNWFKANSGNIVSINEEDFGVTNMFGALGGSGSHLVTIKNIDYTRTDAMHRVVTIELYKVG